MNLEQLRTDGYATTGGRLVGEPPLVKAGVMIADPRGYFARCRAEQDAELRPGVKSQDRPDVRGC